MKKNIFIITLLSAAGAFLSAILLYRHYFPDASGIFSCGDGIANPCMAVSQSQYASLFTIPVAAYGLLFYIFILFFCLIADYAGKKYIELAVALVLPLAFAGVAADIIFASILIYMKQACSLCIATYAVNVLILAVSLATYKSIKKDDDFGIIKTIKENFTFTETDYYKKASSASIVIIAFLMIFAIFSTTQVLHLKSAKNRIPNDEIQNFMKMFYSSPLENPALPGSKIIIGEKGAKLTIHVFTDFLCSACYEFYKVEKMLLAKYKGKLNIVYYNFPLDSTCNKGVKRSVYPDSCIAARAMTAASESGILDEYIYQHFRNYHLYKKGYTDYIIKENLKTAPVDAHLKFTENMNSKITSESLDNHLKAAKSLNINSTPTIFINGRRIEGAPPFQMLDALVANEIKSK